MMDEDKTKESKTDKENEWTKFMTVSPFDAWLQGRLAPTDDLEYWEKKRAEQSKELIDEAKKLVDAQHKLDGKILEFCMSYGIDVFEKAKNEYFDERKEFEEMVQKLTETNEGEE